MTHDAVAWSHDGGGAENALLMSLVAGLSTGLGGCVVFFVSNVSNRTMALTLSLAAGVMTSVSILELMKPFLHGTSAPVLWALTGAAFYASVRRVIPEPDFSGTPVFGKDEDGGSALKRARQWRLGVLMMVTLTAHNLPEGVAVAVGAMHSARTGAVVMTAIAMHNIPEGLAIAVPIYAATGSRWKALCMSLASGLSEPLGAGLGIAVLRPLLSHDVIDNATCAVGGIMLAVSLLELLPEARKHRDPQAAALGLVLGWVLIGLTVSYA